MSRGYNSCQSTRAIKLTHTPWPVNLITGVVFPDHIERSSPSEGVTLSERSESNGSLRVGDVMGESL
jgi:hypothetical protein